MADDKGGSSGGSGWGTFEIILIILLAVGFLSYLTGDPINKSVPNESTTPAPVSIAQIDTYDQDTCGLTLIRPKFLEKITTFITLSGYIEGCNWNEKDGVALYAQVIDSKGIPLSSYVSIPVLKNESTATTKVFNDTVRLVETAKTSNGYLLLVPATNYADQTKSVRVPISFQR